MTGFFKNLFLYSAGHTYSNLSRLFLRLFTGIMFLQLSIRQMLNFDDLVHSYDGFMGLSPEGAMTVLVVIELLSAVCIMLGFLTRLAVLFPLVLMLVAENIILSSQTAVPDHLFNFQPGYPVMFIGIFVFMLLAGPGKISLDYIIAAHFTESVADEHVIDNA
ncbi:MAG: DoxX family protein [Muribaculaceae bacterium]|nr:DoxX family protein [Muribaculaceae bacterium]